MKAAVRTGASARRPSFKKPAIAAALACPFNEAGVVAVPQFVLVRPVGTIGDIKLVVRAHRIDDHHWIAEATWGSDTRHLPFDGRYPSRVGGCQKTRFSGGGRLQGHQK